MRMTWTTRHFSLNLINESEEYGGIAYLLYVAFINHDVQPGIYMGLRTQNDIIPEGERVYMNACIKKSLMDGDSAVKIRNFSKKTDSK